MRTICLICLFVSILISCKKDNNEETGCPPTEVHEIPAFYSQFNFKPKSYWIFENTTTNIKDSLYVDDNKVPYFNEYSGTKYCQQYKEWRGFGCLINKNISSVPHGVFDFSFKNINNSNNLFAFSGSAYQCIALHDKNIGDSTLGLNGLYSKLENKLATMTVKGKTYSNVYQMYYSPQIPLFKRIWWVPKIGFIKFEVWNPSTMQSEFCELDTTNAQIY